MVMTVGIRRRLLRAGYSIAVLHPPSQEAPFLNLLYASPSDFGPHIGYVIVDDLYAFTLQYSLPSTVSNFRPDRAIQSGSIGTNLYQREWGRWGLKYLA